MVRHLLLALMVILLPLRGWAGDAMATDMAITVVASMANTTKSIAAGVYRTGAGSHSAHQTATPNTPSVPMAAVQVHPDCSEHALAGQAPSAEGHAMHDWQSPQEEHCNPCQSCQACHTVALSASLPAVPSVFVTPVTPHAVAVEFTSALATLGQKPPIS